MTDPRSTVELALALMDEEWCPLDDADVKACRISECVDAWEIIRIAWAASVWLNRREWNGGFDQDGAYRWVHWKHDPQPHDPDPIRATLLAALAAKESDT